MIKKNMATFSTLDEMDARVLRFCMKFDAAQSEEESVDVDK